MRKSLLLLWCILLLVPIRLWAAGEGMQIFITGGFQYEAPAGWIVTGSETNKSIRYHYPEEEGFSGGYIYTTIFPATNEIQYEMENGNIRELLESTYELILGADSVQRGIGAFEHIEVNGLSGIKGKYLQIDSAGTQYEVCTALVAHRNELLMLSYINPYVSGTDHTMFHDELIQKVTGLEEAAMKEENKKEAAVGEILFRGIPWASTIPEAREMLAAQGIKLPEKYGFDLIWDFDPSIKPYISTEYVASRMVVFSIPESIMVAGHKIGYMEVHFLYEVDAEGHFDDSSAATRLVRAEYNLDALDPAMTFDDLKEKLTKLYGAPRETRDVKSYFIGYDIVTDWAIWIGEGNTGVYLEREWDRDDTTGESVGETGLTLVYGVAHIEEDIKALEQAYRQSVNRAEKDRMQGNTENIEGL